MKTIYVFIGMILLFIIIPPQNAQYPYCTRDTQSYQEKVMYVFSDIQCLLERGKINLETRIDNLFHYIFEMKSVSRELYNEEKASENIQRELHKGLQERQELLNELNNN